MQIGIQILTLIDLLFLKRLAVCLVQKMGRNVPDKRLPETFPGTQKRGEGATSQG